MARTQWYVVQVLGGREHHACVLIRDACKSTNDSRGYPLLDEVFCPLYKTRRKFSGTWRDVERNLLPGYVIAVTADPVELWRRLWQVRGLTKLLSFGGEFVALREDERAWLEETTQRGRRVVPLSIAVKDGDTVVVTEGPLKGREALITRINRHKCQATLELHVGGKRVTTQVGLAVLNKE